MKRDGVGIKIFCIVMAVVVLFFLGFMGVRWQRKSSVQKQLNEFSLKVDEYKEEIRGLELGEYEDEYNKLKEEARNVIRNKEVGEIAFVLEDYETLAENVKKANGVSDIASTIASDQDETSQRNQSGQASQKNPAVQYDNLQIQVTQIDALDYPTIRLYVDVRDKITQEVPKGLTKNVFFLSEKRASNSQYMKANIQKVMQLDEKESLSINIVADVSGSMEGSPLNSAKYIMSNFIEHIQFGIGDQTELTAFSNGVYTMQPFTNDKSAINYQIDSLYTQDMTCLYDALYVAVNRTALQNGAKCVIAFTDGKDNYSQCSPQQVIEAAQRYNIPIFIVGVGDEVESSLLENIAMSTNGYYSHINEIGNMGDIYEAIYRAQKELYVIQYELANATSQMTTQNIKIEIQGNGIGGTCVTEYSPSVLMSANQTWGNNYAEEEAIGQYLNGFVKAINSHDYRYLQDFVVTGGPLYEEVYPYIQRDIKEKLLSYEIIDKTYMDNDTCIMKLHETYEILNTTEPLHMRTLETGYVLKRQGDGRWRVYAFNGEIKVIAKIVC